MPNENIKEITEVNNVNEANDLIKKGWVLLIYKFEKQLCYTQLQNGRVQPHDKILTRFLMAKLK